MIDLSQTDTYPDQCRMIGSFPDQPDCSDFPDALRLSDQVDAAIFSSLQEPVMTVATHAVAIIVLLWKCNTYLIAHDQLLESRRELREDEQYKRATESHQGFDGGAIIAREPSTVPTTCVVRYARFLTP